jgi:membrane protein YdbS with pleckstrin-like domain
MSEKTVHLIAFIVYLIASVLLPVLVFINGLDKSSDSILLAIGLVVYLVIVYRTYRYYNLWKSTP